MPTTDAFLERHSSTTSQIVTFPHGYIQNSPRITITTPSATWDEVDGFRVRKHGGPRAKCCPRGAFVPRSNSRDAQETRLLLLDGLSHPCSTFLSGQYFDNYMPELNVPLRETWLPTLFNPKGTAGLEVVLKWLILEQVELSTCAAEETSSNLKAVFSYQMTRRLPQFSWYAYILPWNQSFCKMIQMQEKERSMTQIKKKRQKKNPIVVMFLTYIL